MSIHRIPDRFLNTKLYIFRESTVADSVGDLSVSLSLAYGAVKANVQAKQSILEYELHGRVHKQTHVAYFNRFEDGALRVINPGDVAVDEETGIKYIIIGAEQYQAANVNISDSHHTKLILKSTTETMPGIVKFNTLAVKGLIT